MSSYIYEDYLDTLKKCSKLMTVKEWAIKYLELFPDAIEKTQSQIKHHKNKTTVLKQICARISSEISRNRYSGYLLYEKQSRPTRYMYVEYHNEK